MEDNFEIKKNIDELGNLTHEYGYGDGNNYKLDILKNLKNIDYNNDFFNNTNSLIVILNKLDKIYYIKKKEKKHNATKKK